jgi:hypothetical protein
MVFSLLARILVGHELQSSVETNFISSVERSSAIRLQLSRFAQTQSRRFADILRLTED